MKRVEIDIPGVGPVKIPEHMVKDVNSDGTINCHRCGNRLPPQSDPLERAVGILWNHQGIRCQATETELSG